MAVIKLKMGIKDVVRKETLVAENAGCVAISSNLFPLTLHLTLQGPAFVFNLGCLWPRPETTWDKNP